MYLPKIGVLLDVEVDHDADDLVRLEVVVHLRDALLLAVEIRAVVGICFVAFAFRLCSGISCLFDSLLLSSAIELQK